MKLDAPKNNNYAATIVCVRNLTELEGLDNLIGVPVYGCQALTQKGIKVGQLRVAFTAETQLSADYCAINNLYRDATLNKDPAETGYLERNRRVRAIKLRGHRSSALLMPLDSLEYTGFDYRGLMEGDTFDTLNGHDICCKYEVKRHVQGQARNKVEKAFKRVDKKLFPEHLETDNYWRNAHLLKAGREVVITQKLHGTSWRGGCVPVRRTKRIGERFFNRFFKTPDYEYDTVFGSRKVIKDPNNPNQNHFYDGDIWTDYGKKISELIPQNYIVYGELVGWMPGSDGAPLQKNYTYHLPQGECELYVYRVAFINEQGVLADLAWDGVKAFCAERGLKWTPEITRFMVWESDPLEHYIDNYIDVRFADAAVTPESEYVGTMEFNDPPLKLSDSKTVDEGICLRQEGITPLILKAKSPKFLEHETKLLDKGEVDLESAS